MAAHDSWIIESRWAAPLRGHNEVPPVDTDAEGETTFRSMGDDRLYFALSVSNMRNVTQAHIHKGRPGVNGPIVAWLYRGREPRNVTGLLASGTLTRRDLVGPLAGKSLRSLLRLIKDNRAYVNVHTTQNPEGEIRGQIHPKGKAAVRASADWWQYGGYSG